MIVLKNFFHLYRTKFNYLFPKDLSNYTLVVLVEVQRLKRSKLTK